MTLAITICATEKYTYAMTAQARKVQAAASHLTGHIVLVGDSSKKLASIKRLYENLMPKWTVHLRSFEGLRDGQKNYGQGAQLLIAQLRTEAFSFARQLDIDRCWSLDSDVLPPANSLKCMMQMLEFDDGYYSISTCPYPSQGGGGFLGGRGTVYKQIAEDFVEEERKLKPPLIKALAKIRKFISTTKEEKRKEKAYSVLSDLEKKVRECPPSGNVWDANAKRWRMRGWLDNAYPAIGKGAVLPSDWCGFGCTLINRKALSFVDFTGYDGNGTEDLYVVWNRWYPETLRINVIAHCLCDHVIRNPAISGEYILCQSYHETEGEMKGHLRLRNRPWHSFDVGTDRVLT